MDEIDSLRILALLSTLFLAAVFSMAELLLYRLSKGEIIDVAEAGGGEYEILHSLLRAPQRYHATIAIIKSLSSDSLKKIDRIYAETVYSGNLPGFEKEQYGEVARFRKTLNNL